MNYLFLDIDGVLNNTKFLLDSDKDTTWDHICDENLDNLLLIKKDIPDLKIILSSSWRHDLFRNDRGEFISKDKLTQNMLQKFAEKGLEIIDTTPTYTGRFAEFGLHGWARRYEILQVVMSKLTSKDDTFFILDDMPLDAENVFGKNHFLQTNIKTGLTKEQAQTVIKCFKKHIKALKR